MRWNPVAGGEPEVLYSEPAGIDQWSPSSATAALAQTITAPDSVVPGHRHENEQLGMVVTGSVTFTIGDETRELGPGGTWRIPSDTPHQVVTGPAGAVVIDVFSPVRSDWDALTSHAPTTPAWPPAG
jgi:quercetin dioxygenase-like cupin family protein